MVIPTRDAAFRREAWGADVAEGVWGQFGPQDWGGGTYTSGSLIGRQVCKITLTLYNCCAKPHQWWRKRLTSANFDLSKVSSQFVHTDTLGHKVCGWFTMKCSLCTAEELANCITLLKMWIAPQIGLPSRAPSPSLHTKTVKWIPRLPFICWS